MTFSSDLKIINSCCSINSEIRCKIILYTEPKVFGETFMPLIRNLGLAQGRFASEVSWYRDLVTSRSRDWLSCDLGHDKDCERSRKNVCWKCQKIQKKLSFSHTNCEEFQLLFHSLKHLKSDNSKSRKYHRNNLYFCSKISSLFSSF